MLVFAASALISALVVRRRIDRLDLVEVLTVITRGLVAGDVVIAQPTDTIIDGTRVRG